MTAEEAAPVLVTGATGKQGGAAADHLLERGLPVRALTRDPDQPAANRWLQRGAEVVRGDFDDPASLRRAMRGTSGVFLVSHYWDGIQREVERGIRTARIAAEAGVDHLVFASVADCDDETGVPHFDSKRAIEAGIRELGVPHTFLRPVAFMENWEWPETRDAILSGTLAWPLSAETSYQQIAVTDIGAVAARVFEAPDRWTGKAIELAGDERTMEEIAAAFGDALGREVRYERAPWPEARDGEGDTTMMRFFEEGGFDVDIDAARRIHPDLLSFEEYLERAGWSQR